jgi:hypothetical protein
MAITAPALWLEAALSADPFVADRLIVLEGWEERGRPGAFLPSGVIQHHTACMCNVGHDPQSCINGILAGNSVAPGPVSQLLGTFTPPGVRFDGDNHDPRIVLIAAGRCNHAGVGEYRWGAPMGNGSSIGIEWCGPALDGMPPVVVELYERVVAAIVRNRNWTVEQVTTHWEYARPLGRKIDLSGPWEPQPDLGRTEPQHPDIWRGRVQQRLSIPIPPGGDDMFIPTDPALSRVLDTRDTPAPEQRGNRATRVAGEINVHAHLGGLPQGTRAVAINVTAVDSIGPGAIIAWPSGPAPDRSCGNYIGPHDARSGFTIVELSGFGTFQLYAGPNATHVIVDVVGAFT